MYKFLRNRVNIVKTLPLFYFSFKYANQEQPKIVELDGNKITNNFNFIDLLLPSLKESFELANNKLE
jgi:hypothetical protein